MPGYLSSPVEVAFSPLREMPSHVITGLVPVISIV
jgi:hypothetical protein